MSTNSSIAVKKSDGVIQSIYCHWDGYPSHNGKMLLKHYNSQEKAEQVISLGDLSFLDASMEKPEGHSYDNAVKGYSVAYGRDRGEEDTEANTIADYKWENSNHPYNYFWDGEKWLVNGEVLTQEIVNKGKQ
jgi:hypothetical protein